MLVTELNAPGQMVEDVRLSVNGKVKSRTLRASRRYRTRSEEIVSALKEKLIEK